jgi:MFS family permease
MQDKLQTKQIFRLPIINKMLLIFGLTTFFCALSDGIMAYFVPIIITNAGYSSTEMGILYSSSAVMGALFDFILSKILNNSNYKRIQFYAIVLCVAFPFLMFTSSIIWFFLAGMAVWALYANFSMYAYYEFIAQEAPSEKHAESFAYLNVFGDLGYGIGPLIAAQYILVQGDRSPMIAPIILAILGMITFIGLIVFSRRLKDKSLKVHALKNKEMKSKTTKQEIQLWLRVGRKLWPMLVLAFTLGIVESIFWTVSPLVDNISSELKGFGGILLTASILPSLLIGWTIGPITNKYSKKMSALFFFLLSNLVLFAVGYVSNAYVIILLVAISSLLQAIVYPLISGAFADYLKESQSYDNEILTTKDFFGNMSYILGPLVGGILIDQVGSMMIFSYIAIFGAVVSVILMFFTPRNIDFHDKSLG